MTDTDVVRAVDAHVKGAALLDPSQRVCACMFVWECVCVRAAPCAVRRPPLPCGTSA